MTKKKLNEDSFYAGVYAAALTPMHEDYRCNYEELAKHCHDLVKRGCQGVVLFGTTGEGPSFSVEERKKVIKEIIKLGVDPKRLIIGISCSSIDDAVNLTATVVDLHCVGVLMLPPYFFKNVDEAGVTAFYREVIQRVARPELRVILYHIPQYSGVSITINIIKTLLEEFPNTVIGLKESEGNIAFAKEIISTFPDFKMFAGSELLLSEVISLGGFGGISGMANPFPELICQLYEYGKNKQAPNRNPDAQNLRQALRQFPTFPAIKAIVAAQKGSAWNTVRPPLSRLNKQQSKALIDALKQHKLM